MALAEQFDLFVLVLFILLPRLGTNRLSITLLGALGIAALGTRFVLAVLRQARNTGPRTLLGTHTNHRSPRHGGHERGTCARCVVRALVDRFGRLHDGSLAADCVRDADVHRETIAAADAAPKLFYVQRKTRAVLRGAAMQKFVLRTLVVGGLVLAAAACTDDGEKLWPKTPTATGSSSSSASSSSSGSESSSSSASSSGSISSSSSSGLAGAGGAGGSAGMGGMGGASMGGMGGAAGSAGMGGGGGTGVGAPQNPMNLFVTVVGRNVKLHWTKSVRPWSLILRKLGSDPTGPNDPAEAQWDGRIHVHHAREVE